MAVNAKNVVPLPHHNQQEVCLTRARYRQGRKETAVKVYTIHQESKYLIINGVPAIGLEAELENYCASYGEVQSLHPLHEYPCEPFTKVYLLSYSKLQSARVAKRQLDSRTWYGNPLHVCYAPEFESVEETREKLQQRYSYVSYAPRSAKTRSKGHAKGPLMTDKEKPNEETPAVSTTTYIWAGKEYTISQPAVDNSDSNVSAAESTNSTSFIPRQLVTSKHKLEDESAAELSTTTHISSKLSKVSAPNLDVKFKRKKLQLYEIK